MTKLALICIAIGLVSGSIAALCGVGGGIFMVPMFTLLLDLKQQKAVATSLAIIIPTAAAATIRNTQNDLIHWPTFAFTSIGACLAAYFMAEKLKTLQDATLTRIFAGVVVVMGVILWIRAGQPQK